MTVKVNFPIVLVLLFCAASASAGDWKHIVQACDDAAKSAGAPSGSSIFELNKMSKAALVQKSATRFPWEDCVIKFFGYDWLAPTIGGIAPGSSLGLGLRSQQEVNHDRVQSKLVARGLYSLNDFNLLEGRYDVHMPTFGQWNAATSTFEEQLTLSVFARRLDLHRQNFYGLGEFTTSSVRAEYQQLQDEFGVSSYIPILKWFAGGAGVEYFSPRVKPISEPNVPSVQQLYTNAQAPGVLKQPSFLDFQASLRFHTPFATSQTWNRHDLRINYDHFSDRGPATNTFDRLQVFATGSYELRHNIQSPFHRSGLQNFLCEPIVGDQCRMGNLVLNGLVTASSTSAGHVVPFYLQPTLGGADIEGFDTLRGLSDYRLRAPNRMLFQAEFYKGIWGPLGIYGFYDIGKVAMVRSDLAFSHTRHDFGPGIFIRAGGNIVLRAYIGFGAGEGSHPNVKLFNAF